MRRLSRDEEIEIAICYLGRVPLRDICRHYEVHRGTVHRVITRLGIEADRGKKSA